MKKIFTLIAVALFGAGAASAQSAEEQRKQSIETQRQELMETRHQIRAGIAFMDFSSNMGNTPEIQNESQSPTYSLEYSYRVVEFLEVAAYGGISFRSYDRMRYSGNITKTQLYHLDYTRFAVGFNARYSWFNRSWISLYSTAGVFFTKDFDRFSQVTDPTAIERDDAIHAGLDLVPIGVRIGGKLFGYFEPIAFTGRGAALMFGVGFKF